MVSCKEALTAAGVMLIASATFSYGASAKEAPQPLQPSSNWRVELTADSCQWTQLFGEGDDRTILILDQFAPGDDFSLTIAGQPVGALGLSVRKRELEVRFGPHEEAKDAHAFAATLPEFGAAAVVGSAALGPLPDDDADWDWQEEPPVDILAQKFSLQRAAQIEWLQLKRDGAELYLATGPMDGAMTAMQQCMETLVSRWGIDVPAHRNLTRRANPRASPVNWISHTDYPNAALTRGGHAIVRARLNIDEEGIPADCTIQGLTYSDDFASATCRSLMKRARFQPALDADGKPLPSVYLHTVAFQIAPARFGR